jgi:hypothetical protein
MVPRVAPPMSGDALTFAVPAVGDAPYLADTLASLTAQRAPAEIHVRWVARTAPGPVAWAEKIRVTEADRSEGIGADWEAALRLADTPLVCLAHADDVYAADYSAAILAAAQRWPDAGVYFTDAGYLTDSRRHAWLASIKRRINPAHRFRLPRAGDEPVRIAAADMRDALRWGCFIPCPTVTYRVPLLQRALGGRPIFSRTLRAALDWRAWIDLARADVDFVYVPRPLVHLRVHEQATTQGALRSGVRAEEDAQLIGEMWPSPAASAVQAGMRVGQWLQRTSTRKGT